MAPLRSKLHKIGQTHLVQRVTHKFKKSSGEKSKPGGAAAQAHAHAHTHAHASSHGNNHIIGAQTGSSPTSSSASTKLLSSATSAAASGSKRTSYGSISTSRTSVMSYEHTNQEPGTSAACPIDLTSSEFPPPDPLAEVATSPHMPADLLDSTMLVDEEPVPSSKHGSKPATMTDKPIPLPPFHPSRTTLDTIGANLADLKCQACGTSFDRRPEDFVAETHSTLTAKGSISPHITCPKLKCAATNCMGCGIPNDAGVGRVQTRSSKANLVATSCCPGGRIYLAWVLCCGISLEKPTEPAPQIVKEKSKGFSGAIKAAFGSSSSSGSSSATDSKNKTATGGASSDKSKTQASSSTPSGIGYGGSGWDWVPVRGIMKPISKVVPQSEGEGDSFYASVFRALTRIITTKPPHVARGTKTTSPPESLLRETLVRSSILIKVAELLRNQSIDDMAKRDALYLALLEFVRAAVSHDAICQVIAEPIVLYPPEEQLFLHSSSRSKPGVSSIANEKGKAKSYEHTESIAAILRRAIVLFRGILEQAVKHESDFQGADGQKIMSICRQFTTLALLGGDLSIRDDVGADGATAEASTTISSKSGRALAAKQTPVEDIWHRQNCLLELPETEILKAFFWSIQARQMPTPIKGRMKKLITDVNIMRLSLPKGIYVRHGSSRLDIMKVLIVGPAGTPYEGGLFEFDLFCSDTFPQSPPAMRLKTTGGGRVRFNPNLYADGLVCLSLLNTWNAGQGWQPDYSSLLQVLVSIQAMVFCEEPWYNEPGREGQRNKAASDNENAMLQGATIEHAMLSWLNKLPLSKTKPVAATIEDTDMFVWADVVRNHFASNGKAIMQVVKTWKGKRMVSELTQAMQKHGFL